MTPSPRQPLPQHALQAAGKLNQTRSRLWIAAALALLAVPGAFAEPDPAEAPAPEVAVVAVRPLHTFRGQAVRVGSAASDEKSIGVVRALRIAPVLDGRFHAHHNRFGGSDEGYTHAVVRRRIVGSTYPSYHTEKSIGVVRAYRTITPVVRHAPQTLTNPNAIPQPRPVAVTPALPEVPVTVGPVFPAAPAAGDAGAHTTARTRAELPASQQDDPWALFNHGFYREARTLFAQSNSAAADLEVRTGIALSAALSGDLAAAAELMPDHPAFPEGTTLRPATRQRIEQIRQYLYADHPTMQAALQTLLDAPTPPAGEGE